MRIRLALPFVFFSLAAIVASLLMIAVGSAAHIPGATYAGTHEGGGAVSFQVSQDGSGIVYFEALDVPGNTCSFPSTRIDFATPWPIVDHQFSRTTSTFSFTGTFSAPGQAAGTLRIQNPLPCDTGVLNWTATTEIPPPVKGDVDCNGIVSAVDALKVLRYVAGLSVDQGPGCPAMATSGNVDCDADADAVDALKILRYVAGLDPNLPPGCDPIGT